MIGNYKETVTYQQDRQQIICDLCNEKLENKSDFLIIYKATFDDDHSKLNGMRAYEKSRVDICSTSCLIKNVGAVTLPLDVHETDKDSPTHGYLNISNTSSTNYSLAVK